MFLARLSFSTIAAALMSALPAAADPILVNSDNFVRAESDLYFSGIVANGGFGKFDHTREMAPLDKQTVIRLNRDTLYSSAVFDLDAGPVTINVPDTGTRFVSLLVIDEDHYAHGVYYGPGSYTLTRKVIGTRYVVAAFRFFADPNNTEDMKRVHALQDAVTVNQPAAGTFEIPEWDGKSRDKTRRALLDLGSLLPNTARMFGPRDEIDPVRHLIGAALGWGGNPDKEALYLNVTPEKNDGKSIYRLTVKDVPVKEFWSVTVYNKEGFFTPNELDAYSLNDVTAQKSQDGSITIQFGGCDGKIANCLPTPEGWNYMVRLYRPKSQILDGRWTFPVAEEVK
ncbi:hypothetical protein ACVMB3_005375 [Sinorhizobium meliloti]|jgi:hypothetical protein|uniref:DUF1214 domain-containing protein n=1 Tax=Rhizobium meliloti TaxID=382 RepID=UPI0002A57ADC|nr:DUF1214 domain-containing protein [Sinorhizobium meliloti]AGA09610.1 hypothetical protein C770_GR4pC0912 [Sinorhizobium meliloti GR4]MDE3876414.1 DUF1254 domain-containing protein [Sinorhizobium meliloti]WGI77454.1 DUF1214 domain-containing protein [Sinorhizobium meliloti]WQO37258.1 DUF1214 domain-containing protein [Sinorhizobium meliloti]WQO77740.1 DUF1214 domain-containing protein [Sinorhizobium meliloti]